MRRLFTLVLLCLLFVQSGPLQVWKAKALFSTEAADAGDADDPEDALRADWDLPAPPVSGSESPAPPAASTPAPFLRPLVAGTGHTPGRLDSPPPEGRTA